MINTKITDDFCMVVGKKNQENFNENIANNTEWSNISNFIAANAENNEALEGNMEKPSIAVHRNKAEVISSSDLESYSVDRDLAKTFKSMDEEFKEISINYQSLRSELYGLLDELEEIRGARESLQERLASIDNGDVIHH